MKYIARLFGTKVVGFDYDQKEMIQTIAISYCLWGITYVWSIKHYDLKRP